MKELVCSIALLLLLIGNSSAVPYSAVHGFERNGRAQGKWHKQDLIKTLMCDDISRAPLDDTKVREDNAVKLELYEAAASGKEVVKAKKDCTTFEGDPIPVYVTARGGKIHVTRDYSRDRWMSFKSLIKFFGGGSYSTRRVEIGYLDQGRFVAVNGAAPDSKRLFLRLKGKEYF